MNRGHRLCLLRRHSDDLRRGRFSATGLRCVRKISASAVRQENFWVENLTEQEAQQLLELQGHGQDWKQFVAACSPAAASTCLERVLCSLS